MPSRSAAPSSASRTLAFAFALITVVALIAVQAASAQANANYTQVSAGDGFGCGVLATGNIECWGDNSSGQLGDGTTTNRKQPTDVNVGPGATQVSAGSSTTCAVVSGAAWCWGAGYNGQLGVPNPSDSGQPHIVAGLSSGVTSISTGGTQSCAVVDGAAKCWGQGYLGNGGGFTQSNTPVQVLGLESGVQSISIGDNGTGCVIDVDSHVQCWGQGSNGEMGNGANSYQPTPVLVSNLSDVTKIDVGADFACAIKGPDGAVVCWGQGYYGALGRGSYASSNVPVDVVGITSGATQIAAGNDHACAVVAQSAKCWGTNDRQQLGGSTNAKESSPAQVTGLTTGTTSIAAGDKFSCASVSGALTCWGGNGSGQLANGSSASSPAPTPTTGLDSGVTDITSTNGHSCAIISGAAKCWGANESGQLGTGDHVGRQAPTQVVGLTSGVTSISASSYFTCAVVSGAAYCWGTSGNGGLGGGYQTNFDTPHLVTGLSSGVTKVYAADYSACAIVNGGAKCWGYNGYGQLGTGNTSGTNTPVDVSGLTSGVTDIAIAEDHACGVMDGAAKCWGNGNQGGIGLGNWSSSYSPVQVPGLESGVTGVGVGSNYSCFLQNGGVLCTGVNYYNQLGTGNTTYYNSPHQVIGLDAGVTQLSSSQYSSCVLGSFGARCWGFNQNGESGSGSTAQSLGTPADVTPPFSNVSKISIGQGHGCAIDSGAVKCWGRGDQGELGNGSAYTATPQTAVEPTDTAGPIVTFTSPTDGSTLTDAATPVNFTVTDNSGSVASVQCSADGMTYADCTSPWTPTIAEGDNTFYVQAADGEGNTATTSLYLKLDTQPPVVNIYSPSYEDTQSLDQTIYFYSYDATSSIAGSEQCKVDDGAYEDCGYSFTTTFTEGTHSITVKAVDTNGYVGTSVKVFRVDATAPVIDVTSASTLTNTSPDITFTVDDANDYTTTCQIDDYFYSTSCTSPWTIPYTLPQGDRPLTITATDAAGNSSTVRFTITIDSEGPPVTIDSPNEGDYVTDKTPDIGFTVDDSVGDLASTKCAVDSGTATACTSPFTTPTLTDGDHLVTVTTTDTLGNSVSAERNFIVDTTGPAVVIDSPASNEVISYDQPYIQFSAPDNDVASYDCTLDGVSVGNCDYGYYQPDPLTDGAHSFSVLATDSRGNTNTASVDFTLDTVDPTVSITTVDQSTVTTRTPQIVFTADGTGSAIDTTECTVDGDPAVACTSPFTMPTLTDGWHSIYVAVTDKAGHNGDAGIDIYVDATAPGVTIMSPANASSSLNHAPTIEFDTADPDGDLDQVLCKVDTGAFASCGSPFTTDTLADGAHTVTVMVIDTHGNASSDSVSFTVTSPVIEPPLVDPPVVTPPNTKPDPLPLLGTTPAAAKSAKPIAVPLTCATGCTLELSLKIGKKKFKLPAVKVAAGATDAKIKISKSLIKKIKAAAKKKQKSVLTITPVGFAGTGLAKSIKLK